MIQPINDAPAFPCVYYSEPIGSIGPQLTIKGGMTLRDYFAAAALQVAWKAYESFAVIGDNSNQELAKAAYQIADAMLKARGAK
jgi:hypothetical protein